MIRSLRLLLLLLLASPVAAQAQPTFFQVRIDNVAPTYPFPASGVFAVPEGAAEPGPIGPGGAYTFTFDAAPGAYLTLATMFVQSNDLFYAPDADGIALWDETGQPLTGDVTEQLLLWDAGTEVNEAPGEGANQAPRQSGPDTGTDEGGAVRLVDDGYTYPAASDVIQVTITHMGGSAFMARIENVSTATTLTTPGGQELPVPLSPGVWVVHSDPDPLFTAGEMDRGHGLEAIAEDGAAGSLGDYLAERSGINHVLSPGVWAAHSDPAPLFTTGEMDRGHGLEAIAEDGMPGMLAAVLAAEPVITGGAFAVPIGSDGPGPIGPGGAYEFLVIAQPGSYLTLATMFVQSNDLFYAPDEDGIALWSDGEPIDGDVTDQFLLWDAGTEVNEVPGFGATQAPRQSGPDTGDEEGGAVRLVDDGYTYPATGEVIQVTVTPLETIPFTVRVENVSTATTLMTPGGQELPVPLSPGTWAVHANTAPLFTSGEADRGHGLEGIAEDGSAAMLSAFLADKRGYASGVFAVPEGAAEPGPIGPGGAYTFTFDAAPGAYLTLATMFVQSNDLFYAPDADGIALWDETGQPLTGDVTEQLLLWDAGTEVNEAPGEGANQAPRQSGPDTGTDEGGAVRLVDDGYTYPAASDVIQVTIMPTGTASEPDEALPVTFALRQNYPNPFNPSTRITFDLAEPSPVRLTIYNVLGQRIRTLIDAPQAAGTHTVTWDAHDDAGQPVATGVYLYRLQVDGTSQTRQMVLLR